MFIRYVALATKPAPTPRSSAKLPCWTVGVRNLRLKTVAEVVDAIAAGGAET
jgi:hypothetical protein